MTKFLIRDFTFLSGVMDYQRIRRLLRCCFVEFISLINHPQVHCRVGVNCAVVFLKIYSTQILCSLRLHLICYGVNFPKHECATPLPRIAADSLHAMQLRLVDFGSPISWIWITRTDDTYLTKLGFRRVDGHELKLSRRQSETVGEFLFNCSDCSRFMQTVADSVYTTQRVASASAVWRIIHFTSSDVHASW